MCDGWHGFLRVSNETAMWTARRMFLRCRLPYSDPRVVEQGARFCMNACLAQNTHTHTKRNNVRQTVEVQLLLHQQWGNIYSIMVLETHNNIVITTIVAIEMSIDNYAP